MRDANRYSYPTQREIEEILGDEDESRPCCANCAACDPLGKSDANVLIGCVSHYSRLRDDERAMRLGIRNAVERVGWCESDGKLVRLDTDACAGYEVD